MPARKSASGSLRTGEQSVSQQQFGSQRSIVTSHMQFPSVTVAFVAGVPGVAGTCGVPSLR